MDWIKSESLRWDYLEIINTIKETGNDILKGQVYFLGIITDKLTIYMMFLTTMTVGAPLFMSNERIKQWVIY